MAITEGPKTVSRGCARLPVPKKIRKQISIKFAVDHGWVKCLVTSGDVISEKVAKKHRKQKRSSEETTNTAGKTLKFQVGQHGKMFANTSSKSMVEPSSNSPKGVCAMCAENGSQMLEKMTKTAVLCVFYFHPDTWKNDPILTSIFFSIGLVQPPARVRFFCDGRKTNMFQSSYHDAMMP